MSSAADAVLGPVSEPAPRFRLRIIPQLDTYPSVVRFAQTVWGKLLILALGAAGLYLQRSDWRWFSLALLAITFFPAYRRPLVFASTILYTAYITWFSCFGPLAAQPARATLTLTEVFRFKLLFTAGTIAVAWLLFALASKYRRSLLGKRPILCLVSGFLLAMVVASLWPMSNRLADIVFLALVVFSTYMWYIAYSLQDLQSRPPDPFWRQVATYRPIWSINQTPYGKGAAYWRRIEATDAEQLAVTQLKGIKLLAWSLVLKAMYNPLVNVFYGTLAIPTLRELLGRTRLGIPFHWYTGWESLLAAFLLDLVTVSVGGHLVIGIFRLAGFRALRAVYRPLESRTLAEFWNRYYYYFKELLAEFFFFPTYMRYFKRWGRLRMVAATFSAACLGNMIFHFTRDLLFIRSLGLWKTVTGFQVYAFYCVVLATAISISQLRHRTEQEPRGWLRDQLVPALGVAAFYCVLHIFDTQDRTIGIGVYFRLLGHILNIFN